MRFATLHVQSFGEDESVTVRLIDRSFGDMLGHFPESETTPPLYYVLAWLWARPFGLGEAGIRSLSALAGTLTVPALAVAARSLAGRRAGLIAAALAAVNPFFVWYSQETRAYALLVLFCALGLWAFLLALEPGPQRRRALVAWSVFGALALATHYFAGFVLAAEAFWLLRTIQPRRQAAAATALPAAVTIALLPLLWRQIHPQGRPFDQKYEVPHDSIFVRLARLPREFLFGYAAPAGRFITIPLAAIAVYAVVVVLLRGDMGGRRRARILAGIVLFAMALPLIGALGGKHTDFVTSRNLVAALVPLVVLVAGGLAHVKRGTLAAAVFCSLSAIAVVGVDVDGSYQRPDFRGAVAAAGRPSDVRIVAMNRRLLGPLVLYAGKVTPIVGVPTPGVKVRDIVFLGLPPDGHKRPPSVSALRHPPGPAFRLVEQRSAATWTLVRFVAPKPALVTWRQIQRSNAAMSEAAMLVEGFGGKRARR